MCYQIGFSRNFIILIHPSIKFKGEIWFCFTPSFWECDVLHIPMGCCLTVKRHSQLSTLCTVSVKWESLDVFKQKTTQSNNLRNQFCTGILVYNCQKWLRTCLYMWHFDFQLHACVYVRVCVCVCLPCDVWIMEAACWSPSRCQVAAGNMKVSQREGRGLVSKPDPHNQCFP